MCLLGSVGRESYGELAKPWPSKRKNISKQGPNGAMLRFRTKLWQAVDKVQNNVDADKTLKLWQVHHAQDASGP